VSAGAIVPLGEQRRLQAGTPLPQLAAQLNPPQPVFGVYGPHLNGYDLRRITEYKVQFDAEARAAELARLHPGHEFFVVKRIKRYRVADVPPPLEVYNYPA
jgi:hypothetical protein